MAASLSYDKASLFITARYRWFSSVITPDCLLRLASFSQLLAIFIHNSHVVIFTLASSAFSACHIFVAGWLHVSFHRFLARAAAASSPAAAASLPQSVSLRFTMVGSAGF